MQNTRTAILFLIMALFFFIMACTSKSSQETDMKTAYTIPGAPKWIKNKPKDSDFLFGVGASKISTDDKSYQQRLKVAKLHAKKELGSSIRTNVESLTKVYHEKIKEQDSIKTKHRIKSLITEKTDVLLKDFEIFKQWVNPKNQRIWILMRMPKQSVINTLDKSISRQPEETEEENVETSTKWAKGKAKVSMSTRSIENAKNTAIKRAVQDAMEKVAGIHLQSETVMVDGSNPVEILKTSTYAHCISREILEQRIVGQNTPSQSMYLVKLKAQIAIEKNTGNPSFEIEVDMNRRVYQEGDNMQISVKSSKDCYIYIFNVLANGKTLIVLPNRYHKNNFLQTNQELVFPGPNDRQRGVRFKADILGNSSKVTEKMVVVATLKKENLADKHFREAIKGNDLSETDINTRLYKNILKIPPKERTTRTKVYEVHKVQ